MSDLPPYLEDSAVRGGGVSEGVTNMRRIRSIAARTPAIAIAGLAVALTLGGGALASTHLVPGPSQGPIHTMRVAHSQGANSAASSLTTGVSWQSLVLQNAWASSN